MFSQDNGHLILTKEDLQASLCVSVCLRARACTWLNNIRLSEKFTTSFRIITKDSLKVDRATTAEINFSCMFLNPNIFFQFEL